MSLSGGCQCGAVRFTAQSVDRASVCHCRMCQKATGSPFGAYASVRAENLVWTRGRRKTFQSSNGVARGFCGDCGTPLTFEGVGGASHAALAIAAFDDPSSITPNVQLARDSRIAWIDDLNDLPTRSPEEQAARDAKYGPRTSFQHPDRDTDVWPPTA